MSVLKGTSIHYIVYTIENLVPFTFMFLYAYSLIVRKFARSLHSFLTVYPWRNENRKTTRHIFALLTHRMERRNTALCITTYLRTDIPSFETLVMTIHLPRLVDDISVVIDFLLHVARVPIVTRIIKSKVEIHAIFVGQSQEHINQVDRRHVATFL